MKRFKNYLEEKAPAWTKDVKKFIFDTHVMLPISSTIYKRVFENDPPRDRVQHLLDARMIEKLAKLQNKRKSISAFTKMSDSAMVSGVQSRGGIVAEIDADVLVEYPHDIMSQPDANGRRWVRMVTAFDASVGAATKDVSELRLKLMEKYAGADVSFYNTSEFMEIGLEWKNMEAKIMKYMQAAFYSEMADIKKVQGKVVAEYIDGLEAIMKKYAREMKQQLQQVAAERHDDWDELIVNKIDIKHLHIHRNFPFYRDFLTTFFPREKDWLSELETNPEVVKAINRKMMQLAKKHKFMYTYYNSRQEFTRAVKAANSRGARR